jgi:beta-glucanase (GH16 family)
MSTRRPHRTGPTRFLRGTGVRVSILTAVVVVFAAALVPGASATSSGFYMINGSTMSIRSADGCKLRTAPPANNHSAVRNFACGFTGKSGVLPAQPAAARIQKLYNGDKFTIASADGCKIKTAPPSSGHLYIRNFVCTGGSSVTTPPPPAAGQPPAVVTGGASWRQVFDDEFSGTKVDSSEWNVGNDSSFGSANSEQECYMAANTTESGGALNLRAKSGGASCPGYKVSSGMVTQRDQDGPQHFSYVHGYIEARIRTVPFGPAAWPAFWLVGAQGTGGWPAYGEFDIMEAYGLQPGYAETGSHFTSPADAGNVAVNVGSVADWHTYGLNWTASALQYVYDGRVVSTVNATTASQKSALQLAHSVILNYAIGGDGPAYYGYNGDPTSSLPSTMSVDYVRAWQK